MAELETTITYLEMDHPPARTPPRPAGGFALMRAKTPPTHFFLYLYRVVGAPYHWIDLLAWPDEALRAFVQDPKVELTVLHREGAPAGFYQLDFREAGVCNLAYFGLTPESVGRGVGPWLLATALHEAWSREGVARVTVNTCTLDHPKALALYQRFGFTPVRRETKTVTVSDSDGARF